MFTNKPEFRVKEVIQLSKLSSEILNNLLIEANVYLTKRILTYVLAQQISIQIASDRELVHLRGYASELEDYTLLQLLNFTDSQGIEVDTFDIKFRLWTVVFNNLRELSIRDSWIQKHLEGNEPCFEYTQDLFNNLTRFIDEPNDIDGQPFIIAKESLTRFSNKEEVEALAKSIGLPLPSVLDKEATVDFILRDLGDTNPELKSELMKKSVKEIEKFAKENYISTEFSFTKKELVNYILDNYDQLDEHIRNIEYQKHLEIPSLYKYQSEDSQQDSFKPNKVFDQELKEMIATIINTESDESETISEEKSKEELDQVMNDIAKTYTPAQRSDDQVILKRFDELERKIQDKNNYDPNMISLMNKINHMEAQLNPTTISREDMLLKKIEGLEDKISKLASGQDPDLSEAKKVEVTLLNRIAELEEKLSFQNNPDYKQKVSTQSEQTIVGVQSEEIPQKNTSNNEEETEYEYDMDHFIPKAPVLEGLIPEDQKVDSSEEKDSEVVEQQLLDKLAEIEAKLEEKDSEIEVLKEEVETSKKMGSEELSNAKKAKEEAEKKLAEQNKELQVLRFLSKKEESEETEENEEVDELVELEKLDPYNVDELEEFEQTEEDIMLDEETDDTKSVQEDSNDEQNVDAESKDDIDSILSKIGVSKGEPKNKKGFSMFGKKNTEETEKPQEPSEVEEDTQPETPQEEPSDNNIDEEDSLGEILDYIGEMESKQEKVVKKAPETPEKSKKSTKKKEKAESKKVEEAVEKDKPEEIIKETIPKEDVKEVEKVDDNDNSTKKDKKKDKDKEKVSEFDKFIEEIHSSKDKDNIKVRRRHTLKPITVFWKALAIWAMLVSIGGVILIVYNNL